MKSLAILLTLSFGIHLQAKSDCIDSNLRNIKNVQTYKQLQYLSRFTKTAHVKTLSPAGLDSFFKLNGQTYCRNVMATHLTHTNGTQYIIYTTHDDSCDGGNTLGVMINLDTYASQDLKISKSIVGIVSDSDFICR